MSSSQYSGRIPPPGDGVSKQDPYLLEIATATANVCNVSERLSSIIYRALSANREVRREAHQKIKELPNKLKDELFGCFILLCENTDERIRGEALYCLGELFREMPEMKEEFFYHVITNDDSSFVKACCANVFAHYIPLCENTITKLQYELSLYSMSENTTSYERQLIYYASKTLNEQRIYTFNNFIQESQEDFKSFYDFSEYYINNIYSHMQHCFIIAITGISCVGKSTLAKIMANYFRDLGKCVQIIRVDDYLLDELKGTNSYTSGNITLSPRNYNWSLLNEHLGKLRSNENVTMSEYVRGVGWRETSVLASAHIFILDGLFLDADEVYKEINPNEIIILSAKNTVVENLRRKRDSFIRRSTTQFRTEQETEEEISKTFKAYQQYTKNGSIIRKTCLCINSEFEVEIIK